MIQLGCKVRDKVSGLEGIVIGMSVWLSGCDRYIVQAPARDGKRPDPDSFDEHNLEVIQTAAQTGIQRKDYIQIEENLANPPQLPPGGPEPRLRRW